ncbi:carboxypeptidase regulatory-like domain-containing protein [Anaeromyxobacter diazotrophicus]|nr:carboxypeptidase regulatory-like domain-containing protein [Anaeromyxobacter diazotrophicus]
MTIRTALALALAALGPAARAGDVVGTVTFQGAPAPLPAAPVTKDGATCGASQPDESLKVSPAGRVALAVVEVEGAPRPPPVRAALGQDRCRFAPHVQAVPAGSTLEVANGDPILHSVRGWAGRRSRFELALASRGDRAEAALERPGVIQVRCDVHAWMIAYVVVTAGPAAVSGDDGTFAVRGVPPGEYTVRAWHERLGERTLRVTVPAEGAARADFSYGR